MNRGKPYTHKIKVVSGEWIQAWGVEHKTGWLTWQTKDGTTGLARPENWEPLKPALAKLVN